MKFYSSVYYLHRTNLLYETYYEDGKRKMKKGDFSPEIFLPTNEKTEYKDVYGKYQEKKVFNSVKEFNYFIYDIKEKIKNNEITDFEVNGKIKHAIQYISKNYPQVIEYDVNILKKWYFDIEVSTKLGFPNSEEANQEILSIAIYNENNDIYHIFATKKLTRDIKYKHEYHYYENEKEMLGNFVSFFRNDFPDILIGFNSDGFDIPYLVNRISNIHGHMVNRLSPFNEIDIRTNKYGNDLIFILGINSFDYMQLYKKYVYEKQESYSLNNIAKVELGEEKVQYQKEYKTLDNLYEKDFDLFIEYNIKDVELLKQLDDKMKFIELHATISYIAKIGFEDAYKVMQTWDGLIYNHLIKDNIIIPSTKSPDMDEEYSGAFVKEPEKGIHDWIVTFDINSLYPNLIISHNISPDTLLEVEKFVGNDENYIEMKIPLDEAKEKNYSYTANGCHFLKDKQGVIPDIMEHLYQQRVDFKSKVKSKKDKYDNMQYAFKILLNSGYGALGNKYFRFYDKNLAEAVTTMGRILIRMIGNNIESKFQKDFGEDKYWCYGDTDAIVLKLTTIIKKRFDDYLNVSNKKIVNFLSSAEKYIQEIIKKTCNDYCDYFNSYKNTFKMSREKICDKALFVTKKKYILRIIDDEGKYYENGKITYTGIEVIRKDTPEIIRKKLKDTIKFIFDNPNNDNLKDYVENYYDEFKEKSIYEIARPKSVNNISKYTGKDGNYIRGEKGTGCPIQSRASILYNKLLKEHNIEGKYRKIIEKDKIRYIYLKVPNPIMENVIGFLNEDELPEEFNLNDSIDYNLQFEKIFINPILNIIKSMNWNLDEKRESLSSFF